MKKSFVKIIDRTIGKTLKMNVNSTSSFASFQPKIPKELSVFKKTNQK